MTEAELLAAVIELCEVRDLWWFHAYDSRATVRAGTRPANGFVDLVLVGHAGALFVELKSADGRRSMAQIRWADRIIKAGLQYRLWRPGDYKDGTIAKELEVIR